MKPLFALSLTSLFFLISCSTEQEIQTTTVKLNTFIQDEFNSSGDIQKKALQFKGFKAKEKPEETYFTSFEPYSMFPVLAKGGDYHTPENSFRVILVDMDNDGYFNEIGTDYLYMDALSRDTVKLSMGYFTSVLKKDLTIRAGNELFSITEIDEKGRSLQLEKLRKKNTQKADIVFPSKLISLEAKLLNEETIDITDLSKNKYTFIEFWYSGCPGCITSIPKLTALAEKYQEDLVVLGVNSRDDLAYSQKLVEKHNFFDFGKQILGIESPAIMDCFSNVLMHPRGFLFDKKGRLVDGDVHPMKLEGVLERAMLSN
ncbi:MAG: TlpA family protein disulfide reductase [Chitinophagales bacterium]